MATKVSITMQLDADVQEAFLVEAEFAAKRVELKLVK
jgi:hypothetical protein